MRALGLLACFAVGFGVGIPFWSSRTPVTARPISMATTRRKTEAMKEEARADAERPVPPKRVEATVRPRTQAPPDASHRTSLEEYMAFRKRRYALGIPLEPLGVPRSVATIGTLEMASWMSDVILRLEAWNRTHKSRLRSASYRGIGFDASEGLRVAGGSPILWDTSPRELCQIIVQRAGSKSWKLTPDEKALALRLARKAKLECRRKLAELFTRTFSKAPEKNVQAFFAPRERSLYILHRWDDAELDRLIYSYAKLRQETWGRLLAEIRRGEGKTRK